MCGVKLAIELVKELESHVRDEHETDMVDCGEMSREFETSDFEIWQRFFGGCTESADYFVPIVWHPMDLEGWSRFFVWRREGVSVFDVKWSGGVRYFTLFGGGEESREDGSERSVGGFRLVREHVSGVGEDGGRKYGV